MKMKSIIHFLKIFLIAIFSIFYACFIFLFYKTGVDYLKPETFTIIDLTNYSYIEYISDFIFISTSDDSTEQEDIIKQNNSLINKNFYYKKLPLYHYKKNIFCECKNNKNDVIINKDINLCYFFNCNFKINTKETNNYTIYKWENKYIYANISRYYLNQGINPTTNKCDVNLGFISCGFYDNINAEICIKKNSMKCPLKPGDNNINMNILYNNIDILFDINDQNNYILQNNINLFDIFPDVKMNSNNNKNINLIYGEDINNFFNDNEIGFPFNNKKLSDKVYIIPNNNNNPIYYNNTIINDDNFYQIQFETPISGPNSFSNILDIILGLYAIFTIILGVFFFHIFNLIILANSFYYFQYDLIFKEYEKSEPLYKVCLFIKIFETPLFFYLIYKVRKLNNTFKGHIWDEIFMEHLRLEKAFYNVNLILFFLSYFSFVLFCVLYYRNYNLNKNKINKNNIRFVETK